jgi:hypothetical protein
VAGSWHVRTMVGTLRHRRQRGGGWPVPRRRGVAVEPMQQLSCQGRRKRGVHVWGVAPALLPRNLPLHRRALCSMHYSMMRPPQLDLRQHMHMR